MKKNFLTHLKYYITLCFVEGLGIVLLFLLASFRELQILIILACVLFYIAWGILHHYLHHDLTVKIVLEYVLFGAFGAIAALLFFK